VHPLTAQYGVREDGARVDVSSARLRRRRNRRAPSDNAAKQELKSLSSADLIDGQDSEPVLGMEVRRTNSCVSVTGSGLVEEEGRHKYGLQDCTRRPEGSPCAAGKVTSEAIQSNEIEELFTLLDSTLRLEVVEKGNHKTGLEAPPDQRSLPLSSGRLADRARALRR